MNEHNKFIFWGSAGHAKVLSEIVISKNIEIIAVFDNNYVESVFEGVPVYYGEEGFRSWLHGIGKIDNIAGAVAIGRSGVDRAYIHKFFNENGIHVPSLVHEKAFVSKGAKVATGTQILAMSVVAFDVVIGSSCIINHGAIVDHECFVSDGVHIAPNATVCGCVNIKKNAFIGAGSVVLPRLTVGEGAVVGAGSVVTRDVPDYCIVKGNPAMPCN